MRTHHDDADARVLVERLEHQPQLVALRHRDDVEGRAVEDDIGALMRRVDLDLETVELGEAVDRRMCRETACWSSFC